MSDRSDSLLRRLSEIDPAREDPGPAEGSRRYHSILEAAMRTAKYPDPIATTDRRPTRLHPRQRLLVAAAAVVVVAAAAVAIVLAQPQNALTPEAALAAAATNLGDATSLRGTIVEQNVTYGQGGEPNTSTWTNTFVVDGDYIQAVVRDAPAGYSSSDYSSVIMGEGHVWGTKPDGTTSELPYSEEARLAPFTEASRTFLEAALAEASVVEVASEKVRDQPATHYRLDQVDTLGGSGPLAQLPESVLGWFGLESAGAENERITVDVWVSDGVIARCTIDQIRENPEDSADDDWLTNNAGDFRITTTFELYDYGADIHVEPPAASSL
jgi:hypothetical protein